ncbi:MAG: hypothetical protein DRP42_05415 [Tenericutes bacterium]|nr:MAG: hypothetical protein DRP42_05415 [Mycoplasmatota bacterium]
MEDLGYTNTTFKLSAKEFGVPQNRQRAFVLSELNQHKFVAPTPGDITKKSISSFYDPAFDTVENIFNLPKGEVVE